MRYALLLLALCALSCAAEPVLLPDASPPADAGPCGGACGAGTVCSGGACVAVNAGSPVDAGALDAGPVDAGEDRPGAVDVGADTGALDAASDAPPVDLGAPDAGADGGLHDAADAPDTGCGADLSSDLANCGACGLRCPAPPPGATIACVRGTCRIQTVVCTEGIANCDGLDDNGCEVDLTTSANCGACGRRCDAGTCIDGRCQ